DNKNTLDARKVMGKVYIAFGLPMAICVLGILAPGVFGEAVTSQESAALSQYPEYYRLVENLRLGMVRSDSLRSFVFLALGMIVVWAFVRGKLREGGTCLALTALVLIDLYTVDKRYVSSDSFVESVSASTGYFQPDEIDLQILADTDPDYRIIDIPGFQSADRSYFHKRLGGYHAAKLSRYEDLIRLRMRYVQAIGYDPNLRVDSLALKYVPEDQMDILRELRADYHVLDMLNARYAINAEYDQYGRPVRQWVERNDSALGNAWFVRQLNYVDSPRAEFEALAALTPSAEAVADRKFESVLGDIEPYKTSTEGDTIYQTFYSPNRLVYRAVNSTPAVAVFSEIYFPWGWKASIDGKDVPLARVNYVLRALRVPEGDHEIEMVFDPDSLHVTENVAYACVTVIYLFVIAGVFISFRCYRCED
ncbi:MAG: YfhO family protein, partial [Muribaculaceae bacterium]|nr:YfhO family protein [Muribaculaceae bacterium]